MSITRIQLRRGSLNDWSTEDPILEKGEKGVILDSTGKVIAEVTGDGTTSFKMLPLYRPEIKITSTGRKQTGRNLDKPLERGVDHDYDTYFDAFMSIFYPYKPPTISMTELGIPTQKVGDTYTTPEGGITVTITVNNWESVLVDPTTKRRQITINGLTYNLSEPSNSTSTTYSFVVSGSYNRTTEGSVTPITASVKRSDTSAPVSVSKTISFLHKAVVFVEDMASDYLVYPENALSSLVNLMVDEPGIAFTGLSNTALPDGSTAKEYNLVPDAYKSYLYAAYPTVKGDVKFSTPGFKTSYGNEVGVTFNLTNGNAVTEYTLTRLVDFIDGRYALYLSV